MCFYTKKIKKDVHCASPIRTQSPFCRSIMDSSSLSFLCSPTEAWGSPSLRGRRFLLLLHSSAVAELPLQSNPITLYPIAKAGKATMKMRMLLLLRQQEKNLLFPLLFDRWRTDAAARRKEPHSMARLISYPFHTTSFPNLTQPASLPPGNYSFLVCSLLAGGSFLVCDLHIVSLIRPADLSRLAVLEGERWC